MTQKNQSWSALEEKFEKFEENLRRLNFEFEKLQIPPEKIFYPEYFDITKNERGIIDGRCSGLGKADTGDFLLIDRILKKLNSKIRKTAKNFNWTSIDGIAKIFKFHGICSRKESFIRSIGDSFRIQWNFFGAFHPTAKGNQKIAEKIWRKMIPIFT